MTAGKEVREPSELTPHPKNGEIYGDGVDQSFIDRIEEHGIQDKVKVTPESHFTDAEGTIIGGHRRVRAAKQLDLSVPVEVVGPFSTPVEEVKALLIDNDHRDKSPVQEIHEVDEWKEVYKESPKLETNSAVEEACQHVSFGKSTYWDGKKIERAAKEGMWGQRNPKELRPEVVTVAREQWELLKRKEEKIGGAYKTVKKAKEQAEEIEIRGKAAPEEVARKEFDIDEPVRAAFPASVYRFKQLLDKVRPVRSNAEEGEADLRIEVYDEEIQVHTVASKYSFSEEWFGGVSITIEDGPIWIYLKHADLANRIGLLEGDIRVELRGDEDSNVASHLLFADEEEKVAYFSNLSDMVSIEGSTITRQEKLGNSPLSEDSS